MPRARAEAARETQGAHRGVVAFDLDGTLLDDIAQIGRTAGRILHEVFGSDPATAEKEYFRTTGKPFELQLQEIYPQATEYERFDAARRFHQAKVDEAYAHAAVFPEVPRLLKRLDRAGWALAVATGAEREMAEVVLEREGLAFLFEEIRGARDGTKDEHLRAYLARWPGRPLVLVGDSRFDIEAARSVPGVTAVGRASRIPAWPVPPSDLRRWGAAWADYDLQSLPEVLEELFPAVPAHPPPRDGPPGGPPTRTAEGSGRSRMRGARTYTGPRRCDVRSCRRRAQWVWNRAYLCSAHLMEEASSSVQRPAFLAEAKAASVARRRRPRPRSRTGGEGGGRR